MAQYASGEVAAAAIYEASAEVARSAGLLYEQVFGLGVTASHLASSGAADRALPLARESVVLARQLGVPSLIAASLMSLAAALVGIDPAEARRLFREGADIGAAVPDREAEDLSVTVYLAAHLEDWETVLAVSPGAIRGFHWLGQRPNQAGMFNIVSRALAPVDAETAALLQGAARRLISPLSAPRPVVGTNRTPKPVPPTTPSGEGGIIAELRHQTTGILRDSLGQARLRELRSEGEAMDDDHVVAVALDAIDRASQEPSLKQ